jgi:hypothetical protein
MEHRKRKGNGIAEGSHALMLQFAIKNELVFPPILSPRDRTVGLLSV